MPITSTWTNVADYILDYFWGFSEANVLKSNVQYLYERFAGEMETGTSVGIGGLGISADFNYSLTGALADVTGGTCTIVTSGRPVLVTIVPQAAAAKDSLVTASTGLSVSDRLNTANVRLIRGATTVGDLKIENSFNTVPDPAGSNSISLAVPGGAFIWLDTPSAGSQVYKIQASYSSNSTGGTIDGRLMAIEL